MHGDMSSLSQSAASLAPAIRLSADRECGGGAGKDLVRRLLDRDYNSRLNAADALAHPWIAEQCGEDDGCDVSDNVLDLSQLRRRVRGPEHAHAPSIILPD